MTWSQSRDLIFRAKTMFTIMWNPSGFYVVDKLLNNSKMNRNYFVTNISIPFEQAIFPRGRAPHQKRLVIHLDNCSVHTSQASTNWLEAMACAACHTHPPTLCAWFGLGDFYLFSTMKEKLERIQVADEDQFLSPCKRFWGVSIKKIKWRISGLGAAGSRSKLSQGNREYVRW
jgi:hypothetical protein